MSTPTVGDRAPEVTLPDENGTVHRLSDQHDRWTLVYFYPEATAKMWATEPPPSASPSASVTESAA